jgi:succinate dehydrogenase / fumarate reductase, membrane anchor subunit
MALAWLKAPFVAILMVLLLVGLFHHMALGLQAVVEDYVHSNRAKVPTVVAIRLACFALAVVDTFATVRIAFDG